MGHRPARGARLRAGSLTIYSGISPSSLAADRYRSVAVRLEKTLQMERDSGYLLSVTSPEPAAGKTLTSLNLALTFARLPNRKVLLVECDLWNPTLSEYLEQEADVPGIEQIFEGKAELSDAVVSIWGTGLEVVTAGTRGTVENLLADRSMAEAVAAMRSQYEIVILDSPPLHLASGQSLAALADGVLLVARAGRTKKAEIEDALSALESKKVLGLVLNRVQKGKLTSPSYSTYAYQSYEREPSLGEEGPPLRDLRLQEAGMASQAWSSKRRFRHFGWRIGLGALVLALAVSLAAIFWLRGPKEDISPSTVSTPRASAAPEAEQGTDAMRPRHRTLPAMGRTTGLVPVRSGPGTEYSVLSTVEAGVQVNLQESDGEWLMVQTGDQEGWVLESLIALDEESGPEE